MKKTRSKKSRDTVPLSKVAVAGDIVIPLTEVLFCWWSEK
jgi:hypothetical protein